MTTQQAKDEFFSLRQDDPIFSDTYNSDEFQEWLNDYEIEIND